MAIPEKKPYERLSDYLERSLPAELEAGKSRGKATADIIAKFNEEPPREMFAPFIWGAANNALVESGDADANTYIAAVIAAGGTLTAGDETAIQTLFTETKDAGVYDKLDCFYPMLGGTQASHAINANGNTSYDLSFNGTWVFNSLGSVPNGTNAYADTSKVISSGEISDSCFGVYAANSGSNQSSYSIDAGTFNGSETWYLAQKWTATNDSRASNQWNDSIGMTAVNGGLMVNVRYAINDFKVYKNQSLGNSSTTTVPATDSGIYSFYLGARNNIGTPGFYSSTPHSFDFFANQALSLTEIDDYSTAIQTFMTTLSRNAY
jgi:hypothetical protein